MCSDDLMSSDPDREGVDATRLARAVRTTTEGAALGVAPHRERHRQTNWLRDVILGGQEVWSTSSASSSV